MKTVVIKKDNEGQRIDNFLIVLFKKVPKSRIYKAIRKGEVRINKKRVKPESKLQEGDEVRLPPFWQDETVVPIPSDSLQALLKDSIIFENEEIIILNKPAGLAVHGGTGVEIGLIEALRYTKSDLSYLELVHRLDRKTSGCLLLAKNLKIRRELNELFVDHKVEKTYLVLVKGRWKGNEKIVDVPLAKGLVEDGEYKVRVDLEGKNALTEFEPYKISDEVSVVKATIKTGRMHQIRVHAAHIGYPVVGDYKYGDRKFNAKIAKRLGSRLFLHSASLSFEMLATGEKISVCASLDKAWGKVFNLV